MLEGERPPEERQRGQRVCYRYQIRACECPSPNFPVFFVEYSDKYLRI
jgi:hypothetical protein